jgi:glycosyltransferase involved in cell wall biosynthesis
MLKDRKVIVVMPAYNASLTLEKTIREIDRTVVDEIIVVDDASADATAEIARKLGLVVRRNEKNLGYGGNQKRCYAFALERGADIVIMVHPDYQYDPRLVPAMCQMLVTGVYDIVLGSRILGSKRASRGMPLWRWIANRFLTLVQNSLLGEKLSEYHTGYRAFTKEVLQALPLERNSGGFVFDNEILCQAIAKNFRIGEISCPTRYLNDSSSVSFPGSIAYGFGVLRVTLQLILHRCKVIRCPLFT